MINSVDSSFFPLDYTKFLTGAVGGMGCGYAVHLYDRRLFPHSPPPQGVVKTIETIYHRFPRMGPPGVRLAVGALLPAFEEAVFRGIIRNKQIEHTSSSVGERSLLNASLFALCHLQLSQGWHANLRLFQGGLVAGLVFNALTEATENLWGSTVAHGLINSLALKRNKL